MNKSFVLSMILCASIGLYALNASAAIVASGDDCAAEGSTCHWELNSDGKLSITGSGSMKENFGNRSIAENTKVSSGTTTAASYGDYWNQITSIEIGEGITNTGQRAFQGLSNVTSVSIPASLETMGAFAFDRQPDMNSFNIAVGSKLKNLGNGVFQNAASMTNQDAQKVLDTVSANNTTFAIGDYTFGRTNLSEITIPDNVTGLGQQAFYGNNLTSVEIPNGVTTIGEAAFYENGEWVDGKWKASISSLSLPDTLTEIGAYAFRSHGLTELVIPDSVTTIGDYAFNGRKNVSNANDTLTSIYIPDSVKYIGEGAFKSNFALSEIIISDDLDTSGWVQNVFYEIPSNITIRCQGDLEKCQQAMARYIGPSCQSSCLNGAVVVPVDNPEQCTGKYAWNEASSSCVHRNEKQCNAIAKYYYNGIKCVNRPTDGSDLECTEDYYPEANLCSQAKLRYTMQEADALTTNDNNNWVEWTFE